MKYEHLYNFISNYVLLTATLFNTEEQFTVVNLKSYGNMIAIVNNNKENNPVNKVALFKVMDCKQLQCNSLISVNAVESDSEAIKMFDASLFDAISKVTCIPLNELEVSKSACIKVSDAGLDVFKTAVLSASNAYFPLADIMKDINYHMVSLDKVFEDNHELNL